MKKLMFPMNKGFILARGLFRVSGDYLSFMFANKRKDTSLKLKDIYFRLFDWTAKTGFDRHYIYHTAWAARVLKRIGVKKHVDISSSLYFSAIVSAFIKIKFYDYRPADLFLDNFESKSDNLLKLPFKDNSIESLSCMHTLEHVGLGRYGDLIDPEGDLKAIRELIRVLEHGGDLLVVVPVGYPQRVCFNAHRIYEPDKFINYFKKLDLVEFGLIPENEKDGGILINPGKNVLKKQKYGCGCFWFKKKK